MIALYDAGLFGAVCSYSTL